VAESVFEFIPDSRINSLKPLGPLKRCRTTKSRDSVTIALMAPTTGQFLPACLPLSLSCVFTGM
jgi:hypothetical protein